MIWYHMSLEVVLLEIVHLMYYFIAFGVSMLLKLCPFSKNWEF